MEPVGLNHRAPQPGRPQPLPPSGGNESAPPVTIPDHVLLRRIGAGSYGEVWLARHTMGMLRAVKIVYRASFQDQRPFERELSGIQKFEPISRSHEGFVDVLHVGINAEAGYFYYLMELGDDAVSGQQIDPATYAPKTLDGEIAHQGKLALADCLKLGLALSQALAELHQRGLVHRDIKPANIIYVNGVPKLADIGLVAEVHEARSYVGTEGFIPPEGPGAPTADVYSLGKVLYEACTGRDRKDFPALPEWWGNSPEHEALLELNEVVLQACQNEAAKRYRSAREMHADLLVVEHGKSVRRLKMLERRLAQLKRAMGFAALGLLIVGALGFEGYQQWRRKVEAHQRQVGEDVAYGNRELEAGNFTGALPYFADALRLEAGPPSREAAYRLRLGATLAQCPKLSRMWFLGRQVQDAHFSPDGKNLLVAEMGGRAKIYDLHTGQLQAPGFGPTNGLEGASYSPDGRWVVTFSLDSTVELWDAASLERVRGLAHPTAVLSARFSPDGLRLVTAGGDGAARLWDLRTGQVKRVLQHGGGEVRFATFSPDGRWVVTCGEDKTARLWDAATGKPHGAPLPHGSWVQHAAFSPDGHKLATACHDHRAYLWEVATGRRIQPALPHRDIVESIDFSPDGRWLATASWNGTVRLWSADTLQPLEANYVLNHGERVQYAEFSPDSRCLVTTGIEGSVRVWDWAGCAVPPPPTQYRCSLDGSRLLSSTNGVFQVWDSTQFADTAPPGAPASLPASAEAPKRRQDAGAPGGAGTESACAPLLVFHADRAQFNANGRFVVSSRAAASASETNRLLEVWQVDTGQALGPGIAFANEPGALALSDDGSRLAAAVGLNVQVWDVRSQRPLSPPVAHGEWVLGARFSPDGNRLATRGGRRVHVWDVQTGQAAFPPLVHPTGVNSIRFSPNGQWLISGCADMTLDKYFAQVWNARTGQAVGPPLRHGDGVLQVAFSPDSRRVATASEDFTAAVWDAFTGQQLTPPLPHRNQVWDVQFSADGHWVATAGSDGAARIWSADSGDPLTPPFWHLTPLVEVCFLAHGRQLFTRDINDQTWLWPLPLDARPVADLRGLARLLSGGAGGSSPRFAECRAQALAKLWERLQTQYPSDFTSSTEAIAAWHDFVAQDSERHQHWFAAAFHLERLRALRPNDSALAARLVRAQENLQHAN